MGLLATALQNIDRLLNRKEVNAFIWRLGSEGYNGLGAVRSSMQTRSCDKVSSQSVFVPNTAEVIVVVTAVQNDKTMERKHFACLRAAMAELGDGGILWCCD